VHSIISRDVRIFIRNNGRYRFFKLYELLQQNSSLEHISEILEIDHPSIMHWKTIFEMIGSNGFPSFDAPIPEWDEPLNLEILINEDPIPSSKENQYRKNFTIH
jgi:hypothetical protein